MNGMDDVLQRFHQVLVEEITQRRPEYLNEPFTVAEIYQNLVPYGTHRDRIGIEMNGDYEDALLRLLAGEGGLLRLESEHALRELREELDSSNPNTGLYREFAAVDVRLGRGADPDPFLGDAPAAEAATDEAIPVAELAPTAAPDLAPVSANTGAAPATGPETETGAAVGGAASEVPRGTCPWCRAKLPHRNALNFCPFCGTDVHLVPCPGCGEELESDWRFCIKCGREVTD